MKIIKFMIIVLVFALGGCDVDYYPSPNSPTSPPSAAVFNNTVHSIVFNTRDEWFMGRFTLATMQQWQQSEYGDEDRFAYRESMRQYWGTFYSNLENLRIVIKLNEDPATMDNMLAYGANENQIACARIMMAYTFNIMADTWGDIPYYSYGSDNPNFQALQLAGETEVIYPAYATQEEIYTDILKELKEAHDQLDATKAGFKIGDVIYNGNVAKWKKFANSLRLKIALKIRSANASLANTHINEAVLAGVFTSNADNAVFAFESADKNASPMYRAWNVGNRSDFAISNTLVTLLKGENIRETPTGADLNTNPFPGLLDPRLEQYAEVNKDGNYVGMPIAESSAQAAVIKYESLPSRANIIDKPDYGIVLLEFSEIAFTLSEINAWDQTHYVNGITASMQKWGVSAPDIAAYVASVPAANQRNVLTQKYIALYMDAHAAWTDYRRTGFPDYLVKPGQNYTVYDPATTTYHPFKLNAIPAEITNDLPKRMQYPAYEFTLNGDNYLDAVAKLAGGKDNLIAPLWWDKN
ncbi:MAG: SusD/RagB family nutrient-binding outer membrane lipoprotein [Tenuifilaceae bacterium]|nr:SusD/RagB family nutrient-binding outer membrane lipoprotein [Tenuifilaceae bacterium]